MLQASRSSSYCQLMSCVMNTKPSDCSNSYTLEHVAKLVRKLIGRLGKGLYEDNTVKAFDRPFNELLFWAVLMNR